MPSPRQILKAVCSIPTVPFGEWRVADYVRAFVAARSGTLKLTEDRFGNLLIETKSAATKRPRLVFVAHTDHPGFVSRNMTGPNTLEADFRGGVLADYLPAARVVFFPVASEPIRGRVDKVLKVDERDAARKVRVKVAQMVPPGTAGMFDLIPAKIVGDKFHSRACDDLAGVASALATLDRLCRKSSKNSAALLLTRGEEEGFIGAIAAVRSKQLLRKSDLLVSIECSSAQPHAKQGAGVVLRVGDRTSVFNSALTYFMNEQAEYLAKRSKSFRFQRALMQGGTCEATVFDAFGHTAAAACVPLANYHNMDRAKKKIAAEMIDLNDWDSMVALFARLAETIDTFEPTHAALRTRLVKRFSANRAKLKVN